MRRDKNIFRGQSGQAIAEMIIAMVPVMIAMVAFLYLAAFGVSNIRALFNARAEAEKSALNGQSSGLASSIWGWEYGKDVTTVWQVDDRADGYVKDYIEEDLRGQTAGIPFTADDQPIAAGSVTAVSGAPTGMTDAEMKAHLEMTEALRFVDGNANNFVAAMPEDNLFVWAAGLASGTGRDQLNTLTSVRTTLGNPFDMFSRNTINALQNQELQGNIVFIPIVNDVSQ